MEISDAAALTAQDNLFAIFATGEVTLTEAELSSFLTRLLEANSGAGQPVESVVAWIEPSSLHLRTTLSGGEQQRVQLARALVQVWEALPLGPRYLLLDEPTNNLDLAHQHRTLQIARSFIERGVGVLAILHDLNLAAQYADTVMMMKAGQALAYGSPQETLTPALIEDAFAVSVVVMPHPCHNCPLIVSGVHM